MAASIAFQQARTNGSAASPLAFTCASAAGQERLVAICGIGQSPITSSGFTSVTIDGQSATQVGSTIRIADSSGNGPIVVFFRAAGTSGTSINVAFTKVGTFFDVRGALWTLSDAGTLLATNSDTTAYSGSGNLGDANLNVNTATDGAAAAIFLGYSSGIRAATWAGLTERYDGVADALYSGDWFTVADLNAGSASTPLTVTAVLPTDFSGGSAFAALAVSFNPAEAGTDGGGGGQQIIDIGDAIDDGTGDPARVAFDKCNDNFTELYTADATFLTTTVAAATYEPLGAAPLASPIFTGDPQAPTPALGDNDTSIATTAFVKSAVTAANQVFYFDLTDAADVATYKRLLPTPSTHAETSASAVCTGTTTDFLIASFITDPGVPGAIEYPAGSAYRRLYGSVSGGAARFRLQIYSRTAGGVETLARDETSNNFSDTTATLQEWLATPSAGGALSVTDRLVAKVSARRISGPTNVTVTLYSEGSAHASQVQTTITTGSSVSISAMPPLALTGGSLSIDLSAYQPLDADLTSLAAASSTNAIYYRSAASTWSAVTIGSNLTFTGGTLAASGGGGAATPGPPQGRLTLQTATPVMTTTQSGKSAIFFTPYVGNQMPIYDGTNMVMTTFTELTIATTNTANSPAAIGVNKVNDWFVWSDAGTLRLVHGPDWTNDTTRSAGTALVMVAGFLLNAVAITNGPAIQRGTYVGTTRSNASSQLDWVYGGLAVKGTAALLNVWNCYNRVPVSTQVADNTNSYTYTTASWRAANAGATMRVNYVCGLVEDVIGATYSASVSGAGVGTPLAVGIGLDVTNAFSGLPGATDATSITTTIGFYTGAPSLGYHFASAIEYGGGAGTTFYPDNNTPTILQSGLFFEMRM